jgi:hypothetical protein
MATRLAACRGASPGANRACIGVPAMPFHWACASVISCTRLCPGYRPPVPCKRVSVISHLLHKVMPGIRTTGALHKGERHKSFPERLGPGYRPPAPLQKGERHKSFPERLGPGYRPPVPCKRVSVISHFLCKVMPGIQTTGALQKGERHQSSPAQGYARDTDHRCPAQG